MRKNNTLKSATIITLAQSTGWITTECCFDLLFFLKSKMLPFARKEELIVVAEEIVETVTQEMREIILSSKAYKTDPESLENFMSSIVEARKRKEEQSDKLELENKLEFKK
ncbi:hypothetical protein AVEN_17944-1 [Araneus ventricosus]|uniref:Uncharacterized protein n=1 Tax=Araneus ventricosus TaxID=182803 RepID=A0A4Y2PSZ0_ARAVE|nr:hypothetical protein AVEN_17944-1 [Araneus ventricosus]